MTKTRLKIYSNKQQSFEGYYTSETYKVEDCKRKNIIWFTIMDVDNYNNARSNLEKKGYVAHLEFSKQIDTGILTIFKKENHV